VSDFVSTVGLSPYMQINAAYPNLIGQTPSGAVLYGGAVMDPYSHGPALSEADVAGGLRMARE
jgi:hypothetical protein